MSFDQTPFDLTSQYCSSYGGSLDNGFCCVLTDVNDQFVFNFNSNEDSLHDLEYYCQDAVDKRTQTEIQWYKVDDTPPTITKDMFGSWVGDCPSGSDLQHGDCYVADNGGSGVTIHAIDAGLHQNDISCSYSVDWITDLSTCESVYNPTFCSLNCVVYNATHVSCDVGSGQFDDSAPVNVIFNEDSTHVLDVACSDMLGNQFHDTEIFLVDSTPPVTTKTYGQPIFTCSDWCVAECAEYYAYYPGVNEQQTCVSLCEAGLPIQAGDNGGPIYEPSMCGGADIGGHIYPVWITSQTPVSLDATDNKVGVGATYWRNTLLNSDLPCQSVTACELAQGSGDWNSYSTPFFKPETSCHLIEYQSIDLLGNNETVKKQCVFVDNEAPVTNKTIGQPKVVKEEVCQLPNGPLSSNSITTQAVGDFVAAVNFSVKCSSGVGVGIAFDGQNLWYSCAFVTGTDLYRADPATGVVSASYDIVPGEGLGALAYDAGRNAIWAGYDNSGKKILLVHLNSSKDVTSTTEEFVAPVGGITLDDGLAYDASDDTLYISPDVDATVYHVYVNGSLITSFPKAPGSACGASGLAIGGDLLYEGFNGCNQVRVVNKSATSIVVFNFSTAQSSDPAFRDEDLECDTITFNASGKHVMWSVEAYDSSTESRRAFAFEIPFGSCGIGGQTAEPPVCGNGVLQLPEQCDDGNLLDGDGCSAICKIEASCVQNDTYITSQTPITFGCEDSQPHPVDHASLHWRSRFATDCSQLNASTWGNWSWSPDNETTIHLPEDSCHELEYFCKDALGNEETHQFEIDIVDTQAPVITKAIEGPYTGICPPDNELVTPATPSSCIIDGVTNITVSVTDPEPHPVGNVTCRWGYTVDGVQFIIGGQGLGSEFKVHFPEESNHVLTIQCRDGLGNKVTDIETFQVDKTPPVTTKSFSGPQYPNDGDAPGVTHWITSSTNVLLDAVDTYGPHVSGVNRTYYRVTLLNSSEPCDYSPVGILPETTTTSCDLAVGSGSWQLYTGAFNVPEDSCHLIEFYSVDNVEKTEAEKRQCVFVDNQGPVANKTVGEIKSIINHTLNTDDYVFNFYPQVNGLCFNATNGNAIDCWKVTTMTPITLDCVDPQPHPVDKSKIFFKVDLDGSDVTQQYCGDVSGGQFNYSGDGYCKVGSYDAPAIFKFGEESEHNLKYYCQDKLGNVGTVDDEKFKVEGSQFNITINKKWNLISVPFVLFNDSMDKAFENAIGVKSVWTYDPTHIACSTDWCVYTPDGNPGNDNLKKMVPGDGYWVLAYNSTTLLIGGSLFSSVMSPPSKGIVAGWNLIGYYGNLDGVPTGNPIFVYDGPDGDGASAVCELGTLVDTTIGYPKWASLWTYWEPYNTDGDPSTTLWIPLGFFDNMDPGAGYWMEIDVAESYSPSTTCPLIIGP